MEEKLLQEIMAKAYRINKNSKHNINVWFSGSVDGLDAFYYRNGSSEDYVRIGQAYLDWEDAQEKLQFILEELSKLEEGAEE